MRYNVLMKQTKTRSAIIEILTKVKEPLDVQSIASILAKKGIKTNQTTIYRTLQTYTDSQLVKRVELQEGKFRYELASLPHHHHIICTNCGKIEDIESCGLEDVEKRIEKKTSYAIKNHSAEFFGLCKNCK